MNVQPAAFFRTTLPYDLSALVQPSVWPPWFTPGMQMDLGAFER
jgi:hypothetical protein